MMTSPVVIELNMDLSEERSSGRTPDAKGATSGSKPCKSCTDFKSWMKSVPTMSSAPIKKPPECPSDKNEIGRASWEFLHTMSVYLPEETLSQSQQSDVKSFVHIFSRLYPCEYCAEDMRKDISDHPPVTETGKDFSRWLCELHNKVNTKLDKPVFDCSKVYERWRDGWKDGSCDGKFS